MAALPTPKRKHSFVPGVKADKPCSFRYRELGEHLGVQGELHGRGELRCGVFRAGGKTPAFSHLTRLCQVIPDLLPPHSLLQSRTSTDRLQVEVRVCP